MAAKFHVQPKELNDQFSIAVFDGVLKKLDAKRIFFTKQDVLSLSKFAYQIDDQIQNVKTDFLKQLIGLYGIRIKQTDSLIDDIGKKPFNFMVKEKLSVSEDTAYADNTIALKTKLYKLMKWALVREIVSDYKKEVTPLAQKKYLDSIEPILRKNIVLSIKRSFKPLLEKPNALKKEVATIYCDVIANTYDPHTNYFPAEAKEEFDGQLGKKPLIFGFYLEDSEDGSVKIDNLVPGSPAYKSGQLNKGDKIQFIQWAGKERMAVAEKGVAFIQDLLEENKSDKLLLTVKKSDGTVRQVTLQKEIVDNGSEDEERVRSFILKGSKSIGYISLPAFYIDWDKGSKDVNGCANDVAKEIIKLKKEGIDGLVMDLRFNGGGDVKEAIDLAGIFIDAGPVAMIKEKEGKTITLKDMNRGTIYDGPLAVMVNGYSASASEMFAGTLQDYHRAIIVGATTFEKATGQVVLPMDTTVNITEDTRNKKAEDYIKITNIRLYRITGNTAQAIGVKPDIALPDLLGTNAQREADDPLALQVVPISANKYFTPLPPINLAPIQAIATNEIATSPAFAAIQKKIMEAKINKEKKDKPLFLADLIALNHTSWDDDDSDDDTEDADADITKLGTPKDSTTAYYQVANNAYETKKIEANSSLQDGNKEWKAFLTQDPYIRTVYKLMEAMAAK
ncbi:S41 family peptidase [Parasediminibacterium sp. JCM 36343]|uniref:S41 family peptidase n=1 Tax=Parasediminibacterium sp. JCM 36343 TaxID=3374279 RepID=UPI00397894F7